MFEPAIKWSGSKRSQAEQILTYIPQDIKTYYEPFCGGCSVLRRLLNSNKNIDTFICSDINNDLISLWNKILNSPNEVIEHYYKLWSELNKDNDYERKKEYFKEIREKFNREKNPLDFMFIMRTTTNGMPRYNKIGEFNNSFHVTRNGITPDKLERIVLEWNEVLNGNNVIFKNCSYEEIKPNKGDFCYLDPPYANTKGMYYGVINYDNLWNWIRDLKCGYAISFDGISGNEDNTMVIPKDIYDEHKYLKNGNSSFKRVVGNSNNSMVYESLYIKH